jgi:hypothetical protein
MSVFSDHRWTPGSIAWALTVEQLKEKVRGAV